MKLRTALRVFLLAILLMVIAAPACADVCLPAAMVEIESQAFMNAAWLSGRCVIPDGAKTIGAQAFYGCRGLTSLVLPDSLTYIGSQAFAGCTGLTGAVTIPEGCEVAEDAFENCPGLTIVRKGEAAMDPAELFTWRISDGCVAITGYIGDKSATSVTVPASIDGLPVTEIDSYAFSSNRSLTSVTLPHTVTTISSHAFSYCSKLETLTMHTGVTCIDRYAFYYCQSLTGTLQVIDADIASNAFTGCKRLTVFAYESNEDGTLTLARCYGSQSSIAVPRRCAEKTVTAIGREAFSYRTALKEVALPSTITAIGQSAFYYCTSLSSITLPDGVKSIGPSAFYNCTSLASIALPDSIDSIGSMAFYKCGKLSGTLSFIDATVNPSAFSSCGPVEVWCFERVSDAEVLLSSCRSSSKTITVPAEINGYVVTGMNPQSFYYCGAVETISLPGSFTAICDEAFYELDTLTAINIPGGVRSIGSFAFYGCTELTSISLPVGMISVGERAFCGCTSLTTLTVANGSTDIAPYAFADCTSLATISMPGDFSNLGNMALSGTAWMKTKIASIAASQTSGCSSSYEKALALHDWLVETTAYDLSHTYYGPEGVLFHGLGVCNAYTLTYSMLLDAAGIPNMTVTGTATDRSSGVSGSHAWTLIRLSGDWYHVDPTWDDPIPDGRERRTYFCLTDAEMAEDHTWSTGDYPAANGSL